MYYEEKIIDGVLMWRNSPNGAWTQCSITDMSQRIVDMQEETTHLRAKMTELTPHSQQDRVGFDKWKDDYALKSEPNYSPETEADCEAAFYAGCDFTRSKLAETQKREQDLLSERKGEGVRTRRAIAEAKKKWLAEVEGQEPVGHVTKYPMVDVEFYENTEFGTALKEGTKLYTHPAPAKVPEGYALVPIEPTDEMLNAMVYAKRDMEQMQVWDARAAMTEVYQAMLKSQGGE